MEKSISTNYTGLNGTSFVKNSILNQAQTEQTSLLDAFGEYYRNKDVTSANKLSSIFAQTENKLQNKNLYLEKKFPMTKIKPLKIKPRNKYNAVTKAFKQVRKLGYTKGAIVLCVGAAIGLYCMFNKQNDTNA